MAGGAEEREMGDRAMAEIKTKEGSLYVYTHWGGHSLPDNAKEAIKAAQPRLGDDPYAVRIIVDQLTKGGRDQETGYGLMLQPSAEDKYNHDNPSVIINLTDNTLTLYRDGQVESVTFDELAS